MKKNLLLLIILNLSCMSSIEAARIACTTHDFPHYNYFTAVCNTESDVVEPAHIPRISAVASDGTMYAATAELHWPPEDDEDGQCRYVQRISRLDGHALIPGSYVWNTVYEKEYLYNRWLEDGRLVCYVWGSEHGSVNFRDLEVRDVGGGGGHRLYVSNACASCETKRIYYIDPDGSNTKTLYYDLSTAPIGVASCEGHLSSFWAGNFSFDDANNLYISSGNHVPAAVFRISEAGLETVTGIPEQIFENTRSGIMDFVFENDNVFYFHGIRSTWIAQGNLETGEQDLVFNNPDGSNITDLIKLIPDEDSESGSASEPVPRLMRGSARIPGLSSPSGGFIRQPPRHTDLLIKDIEIGDPINVTSKGKIRLPVRITITNIGKDIRGSINLSTRLKLDGSKNQIPATFYLAGQKIPYQGLGHGLGFQQDVSIAGFLEFAYPIQKSNMKPNIQLLAKVTGCSSKTKQVAKKCDIKEINITNNLKVHRLNLSQMEKSK